MTCAQQIIAVLTDADRPLFLWEIADRILQRFGQRHSETAISARIRDSVRPKLLAQGVSLVGKAPKSKSAWQYSLVRLNCDNKQVETSLMLMCLST